MSRGSRKPFESILELGRQAAESVRQCVRGAPDPALGAANVRRAQDALDDSIACALREKLPEHDLHMLLTALKIGNDFKEIVELSTDIAILLEGRRPSLCPLAPFSEPPGLALRWLT